MPNQKKREKACLKKYQVTQKTSHYELEKGYFKERRPQKKIGTLNISF